jgi:diguanylate cyclase (GGDEF)-like protein
MVDPNTIWSSAQLPSLPVVALKLLELSRSPGVSVAEITAVMKADPAIVARLLKAANSSMFGLATKVKSIDQAVVLLGTTAVTTLALGFSLVDGNQCRGPLGAAYTSYWLQSSVQATAARLLAARISSPHQEDFFLAGLMLYLGRLAMLKTIPVDYQMVLATAESEQRSLVDTETDLLGVNHVEVGVQLMQRWSLPEVLARAIRSHHDSPEALVQAAGTADDALLKATAVAAAAGEYFCGSSKGLALERLRQLATGLYQFTRADLDAFLTDLRNRVDDVASLFSIDASSLPTAAELLAQANEQLALLAMSAQAESAHAHARQVAAESQIRTLEVKHEQLKQQVIRDPLTNAYNRHFFDESLAREVQRCARVARPVGLIFFDADRFKVINDTYGHAFGDEVLKLIATTAGNLVRGGDILARYGGEEFVVLVCEPSQKGLEKLVERIRTAIGSIDLRQQGRAVPISVSLGAALTVPERRQQMTASAGLVEAADQAMYEAKQAGRNQLRVRNLMSEFDRTLLPQILQRRFSRWLTSNGTLDPASVSKALLICHSERIRVGDLAEQLGLLTAVEVEAVRESQRQIGLRFGEIAVRMGLLDVPALAWLLARQQENPRDLGSALVQLGLICRERIQALVEAYESAMRPGRQAALIA